MYFRLLNATIWLFTVERTSYPFEADAKDKAKHVTGIEHFAVMSVRRDPTDVWSDLRYEISQNPHFFLSGLDKSHGLLPEMSKALRMTGVKEVGARYDARLAGRLTLLHDTQIYRGESDEQGARDASLREVETLKFQSIARQQFIATAKAGETWVTISTQASLHPGKIGRVTQIYASAGEARVAVYPDDDMVHFRAHELDITEPPFKVGDKVTVQARREDDEASSYSGENGTVVKIVRKGAAVMVKMAKEELGTQTFNWGELTKYLDHDSTDRTIDTEPNDTAHGLNDEQPDGFGNEGEGGAC